MRNNVTPVVEGGLLVAVSVVLGLAATYLPIVGMAVEFFCAVPFVILTVRQGEGKGLTALIVSFFLLAMFMGPLLAARLAFTINICGVILGWCITKKFDTVKSFLATFISAAIAQMLLIIFLATVMDINFAELELSTLKESFDEVFKIYEDAGIEPAVLSEMREQISIDALTGINNRRQGERFFISRIQDINRSGTPSVEGLYLFMMDLNKFKSINDTYGHAEGDRALIAT